MHRDRLIGIIQEVKSVNDGGEKIICQSRLLLDQFHTIKVRNRITELLLVNFADAVLSRKLAEALEVSLDRNTKEARLQDKLIHDGPECVPNRWLRSRRVAVE